ncbi:MAG: tRNA (adenosine(37)-N6)-dimethylallyltransferase MiaA [Acholeplasmataceae bacterium]|jgi:tRNA dimethylallyltransferase|nr:tRNA (adenosine(37)-N6)-dimethylallyltransferase MiaA [Acholeplasmataceae bacterium]
MKKVIAIVGPTASGKTKLGIEIAKKIGAEIINGDSVQVYQGLDIGSAKVMPSEMEGMTHHLLDICDPRTTYSVYNFQKDARNLIDQIEYPLIVGGTGLYIKAALYDYEFIESSRSIDFEMKYQDVSNESLYALLLEKDPQIKIDLNNRRRLIRALEQASLGEPRSKKVKKDHMLYDALIIYLDLDKKVLDERLRVRLEKQIDLGFLDEVKKLKDQQIEINAIGYRELSQYLDGILSLEEAKEQIIIHSRQLAKKQKTWFKNQMNPWMVDALDENLGDIVLNRIQSFLKGE